MKKMKQELNAYLSYYQTETRVAIVIDLCHSDVNLQ